MLGSKKKRALLKTAKCLPEAPANHPAGSDWPTQHVWEPQIQTSLPRNLLITGLKAAAWERAVGSMRAQQTAGTACSCFPLPDNAATGGEVVHSHEAWHTFHAARFESTQMRLQPRHFLPSDQHQAFLFTSTGEEYRRRRKPQRIPLSHALLWSNKTGVSGRNGGDRASA